MSAAAVGGASPAAAPAAGAAAEPGPATVCASCGDPGARAFCPRCGQEVKPRLTVRGVVGHLASDLFNADRGLLYTLIQLSRRPGEAVRDYVAGRTVRYTSPVKYFVILATVTTFAYILSGTADQTAQGFVEGLGRGGAGEVPVEQEQVAAFISRWFNLILLSAVPFVAAGSRLAFRKSGHNYAEHLVFNLYVGAQQSILFVALTMTFGAARAPVTLLLAALSLVYYAWAARAFFGISARAAALRSLAANLVGYAAFWLVLMVVIFAVVVFMLVSARMQA